MATKAPWPPRDGGRLLLLETLKALAPLGHEAHLVAPADGDGVDPSEAVRELSAFCVPHLVAAPRNGGFAAMVRSLRSGEPLSIARHARLALRAAVSEQLEARAFDIVHAEQLQALDACAAAFTRRVPVVLRAQNVESDLWAASARGRGLRGRLLRLEAARLEAFEARALERVRLTLALTDPDARRLREMSPGRAQVERLAAPFPRELAAAPFDGAGRACVVLLGSPGWRPNEEGVRWFQEAVWPRTVERLPTAELHVFGLGSARTATVHPHPAPLDSAESFLEGAVLAVPLTVASGVRMKILEAWARGLPVVASPLAARGLDAVDGRHLLLAESADDFANAFARLHGDPGLRHRLVEGGRAVLKAHHDPARVARGLLEAYGRAAGVSSSARVQSTT